MNVLNRMDIFLSVDNNKDILKLPYVPPEVEIGNSVDSDIFENYKGKKLKLIGEKGLRGLSIDSFFPRGYISALGTSGVALAPVCLDFFERNLKKIFRIVIISENININMLCTVVNFSCRKQKNGNIKYNLTVEEYLDPKEV